MSLSHENALGQEAPEEGYVPLFMRPEQEELKGAERGNGLSRSSGAAGL